MSTSPFINGRTVEVQAERLPYRIHVERSET